MLLVANTDEFGRLPGDAFTVKNLVLPSSSRPEADFDRALGVLQTVSLIDRYTVNGAIYLQVQHFDEHQVNLHKRTHSQFPESPGISGKVPLNLIQSNLRESNSRESNSSASGARVPDGFEQFWAAYPKKRAKTDARKAWEKHRPDGGLVQTILAAIASQRLSPDWLKERGRYIPFPATWLNRGQWTDAVEEPVGSLVSDRTQQNIANQAEAVRLIEGANNGRER